LRGYVSDLRISLDVPAVIVLKVVKNTNSKILGKASEIKNLLKMKPFSSGV